MHLIARTLASRLAVLAATIAIALPAAMAQQPAAPRRPSGSGPFVVSALGVHDRQRQLTFSRCVYGQSLQGRRCAGEPVEASAAELFSRRTRTDIAPWRIPTRDELLPLLEQQAARKDSPYPLQASYWTSTRRGGGQYHVIRLERCPSRDGCSRFVVERWSRSSPKRALAILVRDEAADRSQSLEQLLKRL